MVDCSGLCDQQSRKKKLLIDDGVQKSNRLRAPRAHIEILLDGRAQFSLLGRRRLKLELASATDQACVDQASSACTPHMDNAKSVCARSLAIQHVQTPTLERDFTR